MTLGLVLVAFVLVGGLSIGLSLWTARAQQDDALVINLAGRQRMLSQKMVKEAWLGLLKRQAPRYLTQMHATAHQFEEGLQALMEGGPVTYAGATVSVPPAGDPAFRAALEEVQTTWTPLHRAGHAVLENDPGSPAFTRGMADLERLSVEILEKMDRAVRIYQTTAEARVTRLRWIQLAFLLMGAVVLAIGYLLISTQVLRPISALETAVRRMEQGDLDSPVEVQVNNELGSLAQAFEEMRIRVKAQIAEQRALAEIARTFREVTDRDALFAELTTCIAELLNAEQCAIVLREEETGDFVIQWPAYGMTPEQVALGHFPAAQMEKLLACLPEGEALVINEPYDQEGLAPELIEAWQERSLLLVRLQVEDRVLGGIRVANKRCDGGFTSDDARLLGFVATQAAIAIERAREHQAVKEAEARYRALFDGVPIGLYRSTPDGQLLDVNPALVQMLGYPDRETLLAVNTIHIYVDPEERRRWQTLVEQEGVVHGFETQFRRYDGTIIWVRDTARAIRDAQGRISYYEGGIEDITARKRAEEELHRHADRMARLVALGETLNRSFTVDEVVATIGQGALILSGSDRAAVYLRHTDDTVTCPWFQGVSAGCVEQMTTYVLKLPEGQLRERAEPMLISDVQALPESQPMRSLATAEGYRAVSLWPLTYEGQVVAAIGCYYDRPYHWSAAEREVMETFARQAAVALENARLFEALQARLRELSTLAEISAALRGAATVQEIASRLAAQATRLIQADAAFLCLVNEARQRIVTLGVAGLPLEAVGRTHGIDEGIAGRVVQTGAPYHSPDLANDPIVAHRDLLDGLGPGVCVPLRTMTGKVVGTLLVARRRSPEGEVTPFCSEEMRLLTTLAEIAGNALQRARAYEELEEAYIQTVLALAKAMDARDAYTSDHSQRLATWAEATARELGCSEEEIQAVRWGALLHDIGKIGVPDEILRKPGPLNGEEWEVIKRHPEIGAEIVAPVKRLAGVVPIIRHHQERWDGTGYPDGLRGEEIPLGARILAVVDAYGAIIDERPYKRAHSHEEAIAELQRCAGTQFDPQVVEAFLRVIGRDVDIRGGGNSEQLAVGRWPVAVSSWQVVGGSEQHAIRNTQ